MKHSNPSEGARLGGDREERPGRAPLAGIIVGVVLVGGLGLWTLQRMSEARALASEVDARRNADSERAARLAREPALVSVVHGEPETWQPRVELEGTLQAKQEAFLGFKIGGRLRRVNVKVGDGVREGASLAQLDAAEASAQLAAADAQVRAAKTSLAMASDVERRTLPLVKGGSDTVASGVLATQQRALSLAQLDSARAERALAGVAIKNHVLLAPFAGTITQAPTGIGAVVGAGQALFSLVDTSTLKLATTVSEDDATLFEPGAEVRLRSERGELSGHISAILSALDARTRRVPVVVEFDNPPNAPTGASLRAGAFVRAWVGVEKPIDVLRLPQAVLRPGSRDEVLVARGNPARLEGRRILYSIASDGVLLVRFGLDRADQVVLAPTREAKENDPVRITGDERPADGLASSPANGVGAQVETATTSTRNGPNEPGAP